MDGDQNPRQRVMPTLRITDYAVSKKFYGEGLGFLALGPRPGTGLSLLPARTVPWAG